MHGLLIFELVQAFPGGVYDMGYVSQLNGMNRRFSFRPVNEKDIQAAFEVARFTGEEAISTLYRFELLLISRNSDIDESKVINHQATFILSDGVEGKAPVVYQGLVQEFSQLHQVPGWTFYRAVLVPKLWKLDTFFLSEVYLEKKRQEVFKLIMDNAGLASNDYAVKLKNDGEGYPVIPYICQYQESYLNFISRWAERLGTYWWYESAGELPEQVVFSDINSAHPSLSWELQYQSELDAVPGSKNILRSLNLEIRSMPQKLMIMDYQHYRASQEIKGCATVDPNGIGEVFLYGENLKDNDQAGQIARLRAEAILCRGKQYQGKTAATGLRCGYRVRVNGHYRASFNRDHLVTAIRHSGSQAGLFLEGVHAGLNDGLDLSDDFYLAEFTSIPADVQYRSEMNHPWPKIYGTLNAFIDAEGSGEYAEVNEKGEYKIQVPFAVTGKPDAHGSTWIRRATFYAGEEHGIYFPLHKRTEVLLSFINGNPDQPVIMMAVPNSVKNCLVTSKNPTQALIKTAGNNFIGMEDRKGKQGLLIESPTSRTMIRLGDKDALSNTLPEAKASNNNGLSAFTEDDITLDARKNITVKAKEKISITSESGDINITADGKIKTSSKSETRSILGPEFNFTQGVKQTLALSQTFAITIGAAENIFAGGKLDVVAGLRSEICPAGRFDFWAGAKMEFGLGFKSDIFKGLKLEVQSGSKIVRGGLVEVYKKQVLVKDTDTKIDKAKVTVEDEEASIKKHLAMIRKVNMDLIEFNAQLKKGEVDVSDDSIVIEKSDVGLQTQHVGKSEHSVNLIGGGVTIFS